MRHPSFANHLFSSTNNRLNSKTPKQTVSYNVAIVAIVGLGGAAGTQTWGAAPAGVRPGDVASRPARAGLAGGAAGHASGTIRQRTEVCC